MKRLIPFVIVFAFLFSSCTTTPNSSELTFSAIPTSSVTPVPSPSLTSTPEPTTTATATATETPIFKICPPETIDPSECPITLDDLLNGRFADFASTLAKPFSPDVKPLPTPLAVGTVLETGIEKIIFYKIDIYLSGHPDPTLPVQKGATSARVVLPSGMGYDVLPFYLQDPRSKKTVTIIGISPLK